MMRAAPPEPSALPTPQQTATPTPQQTTPPDPDGQPHDPAWQLTAVHDLTAQAGQEEERQAQAEGLTRLQRRPWPGR
ncbi:hypothetical protein [Streptomyces sp. HC307]|uniref:hypothetical protein n=1 Tax=Streptomyces flavusporus TaxID=3385496 RepID=UPI00391713E0